MEEIAETTSFLIERILKIPGAKENLTKHMKHGVHVTSHFSGLGTAEAVAAALARNFIEVGISNDTSKDFIFHSACDVLPSCQVAIARHKDQSRPAHVFGDLTDMCPEHIKKKLTACQQKHFRMYHEKLEKIFRHPDRHVTAAEAKLQYTTLYLRKAEQILEQWTPSKSLTGFCFRHSGNCKSVPRKGDVHTGITLEVGGPECVGFSPQGQHGGWMHRSSIVCLIWLRAMQCVKPDILISECHANMTQDTISELLPGHSVTSAVFDAKDLGFPVRRRRRYTAATSSARIRMPDSKRAHSGCTGGPLQEHRYYGSLLWADTGIGSYGRPS
jgi:hypothetical protein